MAKWSLSLHPLPGPAVIQPRVCGSPLLKAAPAFRLLGRRERWCASSPISISKSSPLLKVLPKGRAGFGNRARLDLQPLHPSASTYGELGLRDWKSICVRTYVWTEECSLCSGRGAGAKIAAGFFQYLGGSRKGCMFIP